MKNMMKATLLLLAFLVRTHVAAADMKITFDETNPGELPKGWEGGITGKGKAKWEVVTDDSAPSRSNVLKQSGEATFCWAAKTDAKIRDGFVEVKFKPVNGKEDQAGGIVWRFQAANNYYRSEAHTSELQSRFDLACRLPLAKKNTPSHTPP